MSIDANSGSVIDLDDAVKFVTAFRTNYPGETKGFFVGADKLALIIDSGCIGIRIYNGYDEQTSKTNLVLVGVDKDEKDMTDKVILERLVPCPGMCDQSSALY